MRLACLVIATWSSTPKGARHSHLELLILSIFQGSLFHRIKTGFCCQGGDIAKADGSSGDSIYGGKFSDDRGGLKLKHDAVGILSMANSGKNSNMSQFFFTLAPAPQCDGALRCSLFR